MKSRSVHAVVKPALQFSLISSAVTFSYSMAVNCDAMSHGDVVARPVSGDASAVVILVTLR